jgi:hypothetical protein
MDGLEMEMERERERERCEIASSRPACMWVRGVEGQQHKQVRRRERQPAIGTMGDLCRMRTEVLCVAGHERPPRRLHVFAWPCRD